MSQKILTALDMSSNAITNLPTPTNTGDAVNKAYADALIQGVKWKDQVRAATTANITLSGTQTIDGVAVIANDRVLVKNQSTGANNGIYAVAAGTWTRTLDADASAEIGGMGMLVQEGTTQGNQQWMCTTDGTIVLGTTALTFVQVGGSATYTSGTGINVAGTVINLDTAVAARKAGANIGDGTSTSFNLVHNFATTDVVVLIREVAGGKAAVYADIVITDTNTVTITFATAPTTGQYRITAIG